MSHTRRQEGSGHRCQTVRPFSEFKRAANLDLLAEDIGLPPLSLLPFMEVDISLKLFHHIDGGI